MEANRRVPSEARHSTFLQPIAPGEIGQRVKTSAVVEILAVPEDHKSENLEEWPSAHDYRRLEAELAAAKAFLNAYTVLLNFLCHLQNVTELGGTVDVSENIVTVQGKKYQFSDELLLHLLDGRPIDEFKGSVQLQLQPILEVSFDVVELSFHSPLKISFRSTIRWVGAMATVSTLSVNAATLWNTFHEAQDKQKNRCAIELSHTGLSQSEKAADLQMSEYSREMRMRGIGALQTYLQTLGYYIGRIDGDFGPKTKKAVIDFARDHGLPEDSDNITFRRGLAKALIQKFTR